MPDGRLIAPVLERGVQNLTLFKKQEQKVTKRFICDVLYVSLRGQYAT